MTEDIDYRFVYLSTNEEQKYYLSTDQATLKLRIYSFRNLMYIDVVLGDKYILAGHRIIQNSWILPRYMDVLYGNFRFETYAADKDEYVWYTGFNEKFRLMYYPYKTVRTME